MEQVTFPGGKTWARFEGVGDCTYRVIGKRCPSKGEFYLSGAVPAAYVAKQHLSMEHLIVEPIEYVKHRQVVVIAGPVLRHAVSNRVLSTTEIARAAKPQETTS